MIPFKEGWRGDHSCRSEVWPLGVSIISFWGAFDVMLHKPPLSKVTHRKGFILLLINLEVFLKIITHRGPTESHVVFPLRLAGTSAIAQVPVLHLPL